MLKLSDKWLQYLGNKPETGMGYQSVAIPLKDGRKFKQAIIDGGSITRIRAEYGIPFGVDDIEDIAVTHEKWW